MISEIFSNQLPATDSLGFVVRSPESPTSAKGQNVAPPIYNIYINRLVQQIDSPELSGKVGRVFQDLLRLLECVGLVENYLRQVDAAEETFALFQLIHDEARNLVDYIQTDALNTDLLTEPLAETLDGITFAISHDLQRLFDRGPKGWFSERTDQVVVGKLYRAHDVLTNCLQQSTITLALVFDPELVGTKLFNNSDMRYRQSLQLYQDLSELIRLVEDSESCALQTTFDKLLDRVERFRGESLECLMYSDWPQFEAFCERLDFAKIHGTEMATVLHQFRCYLETLLGQVRMRNVLADVFPVSVDVEENSSAPALQRTHSINGFGHPQDDMALSGSMIAV